MVNTHSESSQLVHSGSGSLTPASTASPALLELVNLPVDDHVIDYIVQLTVETVDYALRRPSTSSTRGRKDERKTSFFAFVDTIINRSKTKMPTILVALVYILRAKPHIIITLDEYLLERVFLGGLILASKYANDRSLPNSGWAWRTGVFGVHDIGRIEREFLEVLDFGLGVTEEDILHFHDALIPHRKRERSVSVSTRRYLVSSLKEDIARAGSESPDVDDGVDCDIDSDEMAGEGEGEGDEGYWSESCSGSGSSTSSSSPMPPTPEHDHHDDTHIHHPHYTRTPPSHSSKHASDSQSPRRSTPSHKAGDIRALLNAFPLPKLHGPRAQRSYGVTVRSTQVSSAHASPHDSYSSPLVRVSRRPSGIPF